MRRAILLALLALLPAGCGDGRSTVRGRVTLDGSPVTDGSVTFVKADGGQVREGAAIKAGAFEVRVPPGKYRVELSGRKVVGKRRQKGFDGKDEEVEVSDELFPERYNTRSELVRDVPAGSSTLELKLDGKK